jgi:hypothetical protein
VSLEELADKVGETVDRRRFLRRLGLGTLGLAVTAVGLPQKARATYQYKCCNLCQPPSGSCSNCSCGTWCWLCCGNCLTGEKWRCCECYRLPRCDCATACSWAYIYDYSCTKCTQPRG